MIFQLEFRLKIIQNFCVPIKLFPLINRKQKKTYICIKNVICEENETDKTQKKNEIFKTKY